MFYIVLKIESEYFSKNLNTVKNMYFDQCIDI